MIEVIKGDITKIAVDAIVNAANSTLLGGGGVDGAIHRAGGKVILEECRKLIENQGNCKTGETVITTAGNLPAKFVIHTVGPVYNNGNNNESQKLYNCYHNSLKLAAGNGCKTIAFPGISTGVYRFPKDQAAEIAVKAVKQFLSKDSIIMKVIFVCFDDEYYNLISQQINE